MKGQTINLSIANRSYPLVVHDEEQRKSLVKAAEAVNERIRQYEKDYAVIDRQDLLAMTALHLAAEFLSNKRNANNHKPIDISARIAAMEQLVTTEL